MFALLLAAALADEPATLVADAPSEPAPAVAVLVPVDCPRWLVKGSPGLRIAGTVGIHGYGA